MRKLPFIFAYCLGLLLFVGAGAEAFLRLYLEEPQGYFVWQPGLRLDFEPNPDATPGISGTGRFSANSLGLRSDEPVPGARNVIVFGGSTTADLYLDQSEMWTRILQDRLNAHELTWVGSLGRSSLATLHNLLQFEYLVPHLPKPSMFVNLVGANDLQMALRSSYLREMTAEDHMSWTFTVQPPKDFWRKLALVRFYDRIKNWRQKASLGQVQKHDAGGYSIWRKCRQEAPDDKLVKTLPDIAEALETYRRNLHKLADYSEQYGVKTLFVTQPTLWQSEMPDDARALLLAGGVGPNNEWCTERRYYSPGTLADGMNRFNEVLLEVCRARNMHCLDLAAKMPKDRRYFFDDMHFSEEGARFVGNAVADAILQMKDRRLSSN